jgi:hypothetical protein
VPRVASTNENGDGKNSSPFRGRGWGEGRCLWRRAKDRDFFDRAGVDFLHQLEEAFLAQVRQILSRVLVQRCAALQHIPAVNGAEETPSLNGVMPLIFVGELEKRAERPTALRLTGAALQAGIRLNGACEQSTRAPRLSKRHDPAVFTRRTNLPEPR